MDEFDVMRGFKDLDQDAKDRVLAWAQAEARPQLLVSGPLPPRIILEPAPSPRRGRQRKSIAKAFSDAVGPSRQSLAAVLSACPRRRFSNSAAISKRARLSRRCTLNCLNVHIRNGDVERSGIGKSTKYRQAQR